MWEEYFKGWLKESARNVMKQLVKSIKHNSSQFFLAASKYKDHHFVALKSQKIFTCCFRNSFMDFLVELLNNI
ncbi:CLUMA_CG008013, isoform A [Clunio marinus]|uniref:CLUMA_CG008013, isoform A n=1 Tax=Clunio marinus TaxID=568069 RepID=A0A1J1I4J1_9DIPT|nr:CLUMA_CG008013, isoform A [Clunio marinus]